MAVTTLRPASIPQINYIRDLAAKITNWQDHLSGQPLETVFDILGNVDNPDPKFVSLDEAKAVLNVLVPLSKKTAAARPAKPQATGGDFGQLQTLLKKINPGKYALPRRNSDVVDFFEVVERKNGVRYLNQLLGGGQGGSKFNRKHLSNQLQACAARHILEDLVGAAKLFAVVTKTCPRCFTALTHPRSIKAGIGHDCATAWGWSW